MKPIRSTWWAVIAILLLSGTALSGAAAPAIPPSLAILPFIAATPDSQPLADRMRFAVGQKMSRSGNFKRLDDHDVDMMISALQIPWTPTVHTADIQQVIKALGVDQTVMGFMSGRRLTLELFIGSKLTRTVSAAIPPDTTSPRLTIEKMLTKLDHISFQHVREQQFDPAPAVAALFARRPNLVRDPNFALAGGTSGLDSYWEIFLEQQDYHPRLISAGQASALSQDRAAIVPQSMVAGSGNAPAGRCLMMRIGKYVAENNGLACESAWIPIQDGHRYRFAVEYHSTGPIIRIFLKGFAYWPDSFSNPANPAGERKEIYRAQVLPVGKSDGWNTTMMDITPTAMSHLDKQHPIRWLRIDFYIYLQTGDAFFRNVQLKDITGK